MDNNYVTHSYLILLLPLLAFVVNGLYLGRKNWRIAAWFSTACIFVSLIITMGVTCTFYHRIFHTATPVHIAWEWTWLNFEAGLSAKIGMFLDPISVMMLVVICVIAFFVNIYSIGYMEKDPAAGRFFGTLSLFTFSMLGLVISTNLIQMFIFWELVGVSSYLLIGFWYHKPEAVSASKKAFIVTRFADMFFLLGIMIVGTYMGSFDFLTVNSPEALSGLKGTVFLGLGTSSLLTVGTLCIFAGGWGKSAMFPLHIWLPDAMEGPTPVSSIIHSATMVVAGVFLTARMFPLFAASEITLYVIEFIGAFTALFAAVIACTQKDIKRILAFSTLSQLGYMIFALGSAKLAEGELNVLGFNSSMFHIFTHAFFKCLLFLMAGSVIHAVHSNDIWKMGGLKKYMPWTYWSCLIACLAIAGIFPFSGFWSKDEIILAALQGGNYITFGVGLLAGGLTAFYMFRMFFVVFHGTCNAPSEHVHEEKYMTFSIVSLAIPSALAGYLCVHFKIFHHVNPLMNLNDLHFAHPMWLPFLATGIGVLGVLVAFYIYGRKNACERAEGLQKSFGKIHTVIVNKFYFDELYLFITKKIIFNFIAAPIKWFDRNIVDGTMNLIGSILHFGGFLVRVLQWGQVQLYAFVFLISLVILVLLGGVK